VDRFDLWNLYTVHYDRYIVMNNRESKLHAQSQEIRKAIAGKEVAFQAAGTTATNHLYVTVVSGGEVGNGSTSKVCDYNYYFRTYYYNS
jgi:hypothetical protein